MNRTVSYTLNIDGNGTLEWYHLLSSIELKTKGGIQKRNVYFHDMVPVGNGFVAGGSVGAAYEGGQFAIDSALLVTFNNAGNSCKDSAAAGTIGAVEYSMPVFTYETSDIAAFIKIKDTAFLSQTLIELGERDACESQHTINNMVTGLSITSLNTTAGFTAQIYPNPVAGNALTLTMSGIYAGNIFIVIHDIAGKSLYAEKIFNNTGTLSKTITVASLAPGTYVITISNGKAVKNLRFIKQ